MAEQSISVLPGDRSGGCSVGYCSHTVGITLIKIHHSNMDTVIRLCDNHREHLRRALGDVKL